MKLSDLYAKTVVADARKFEVLRSDGTPSSNFITLKDGASKDVVSAQFKYQRVVTAMLKKFEESNKALYDECEAAKNFSEYNYTLDIEMLAINKAFAAELIESWDFDDKFTSKNVAASLEAFSAPVYFALANQVVNALKDQSAAHAKK
jgi:hypothetical protein